MPTSAVTNIVVGVLVVALLAGRQLRTRPLRERSAARIVAILGIVGVIEIVDATKGHHIGATTIAWIAGSLVVGGALGVARALTVHVWRQPDGTAMRKGTAATVVLWAVALGAHLAMEAGIDSSTTIAGFGASTVLLYLAVTLGAQRELLRWRASRMASQSPQPEGSRWT